LLPHKKKIEPNDHVLSEETQTLTLTTTTDEGRGVHEDRE